MKPFFETFPSLKVNDSLQFLFEETRVDAVSLVKTGNFLRVRLQSKTPVSDTHIRQMEGEIAKQVLNGAMPVQIVCIREEAASQPKAEQPVPAQSAIPQPAPAQPAIP